jgi:hypothetical protein
MRRRDLLKAAGVGSIGVAALPALLQADAAPASAQTAAPAQAQPAAPDAIQVVAPLEMEFQFVAVSSAGKVGGVEHYMAASGNGSISSFGIDGAGAFTHYDNASDSLPKPILSAGTWRAKRLIGGKELGSFGSLVAGVADFEVELTRQVPSPATLRGRLRLVSNLSPAGVMNGEPSGYSLTIFGGPVGPFRQLPDDAGMTIFSKVGGSAQPTPTPVPTPTRVPGGKFVLPDAVDAPQADTPQKATLIEPGKMLKGHLAAGGSSGQFAYYKFDYSGGGTFTVNLNVFPDQYEVLQHAGFNVYGPNRWKHYATGSPQHLHRPNVSGDFESPDKGIYTVQVYNYNRLIAIDFEVGGIQGTAGATGEGGLPPGEDGEPDDGGPDV